MLIGYLSLYLHEGALPDGRGAGFSVGQLKALWAAAGVASVQLEFGIPIGNGILTTDTDEQAKERAEAKGHDAVLAAVEMANLLAAIDDQ